MRLKPIKQKYSVNDIIRYFKGRITTNKRLIEDLSKDCKLTTRQEHFYNTRISRFEEFIKVLHSVNKY